MAIAAPPVSTLWVIASPPPIRSGANHPRVPTAAPTRPARRSAWRKDQPARGRARREQQSVVGDSQETCEGSEHEIERPRSGVAVAEPADVEVRRVAEEQARDPDGGGGGAEGGNGDPALESLHQFLENEDSAGDRRVERGAEARAGSGRD